MTGKIFPIFFLIFSTFVLLIMSFSENYYPHLSTDVFVYRERANFFLEHHNLSNFSFNEYQPGAILFFILLSPTIASGGFVTALFLVNLLLTFVNALVFYKWRGKESLLIYSLILLSVGPIIIFRFDLLVVTLVNLGLFYYQKKKEYLAVGLLGIATIIKVYPVIFLPYLVFIKYKQGGLKSATYLTLFYLGSILSFLFFYTIIFQANLADLLRGLNYHSYKPVGLESPWATFISIIKLFQTNNYPKILTEWGIWGIDQKDIFLPLWFYNYFWIVPFLLLHFWLLFKKSLSIFDLRFLIINILIFLIVSKVVAPQYLIWFLFLVPLVKETSYKNLGRKFIFFLILIIPLLYQIIYPLNYTSWLLGMQHNLDIQFLFFVNTLKNISLVLLCLFLIYDLKTYHE